MLRALESTRWSGCIAVRPLEPNSSPPYANCGISCPLMASSLLFRGIEGVASMGRMARSVVKPLSRRSRMMSLTSRRGVTAIPRYVYLSTIGMVPRWMVKGPVVGRGSCVESPTPSAMTPHLACPTSMPKRSHQSPNVLSESCSSASDSARMTVSSAKSRPGIRGSSSACGSRRFGTVTPRIPSSAESMKRSNRTGLNVSPCLTPLCNGNVPVEVRVPAEHLKPA
mmetsp:Transcript_3685/g.7537  ORF Transcript_3685/g.7537 Transcript_3685/m.7537 type:complete len:225 (+) Transcript_3685:382-1056(+)